MVPEKRNVTGVYLLGRKSVKLELNALQASTVEVAGSFGGWKRRPMKHQSTGSWVTTVRLPKGVYEYKFIVDGQWWMDPQNGLTRPDGYGGLNSLLRVE
jgi:1,4-alpha-glucan branching enzyme